ncbi:hopanoid biosynthesis associated protein HpnK [Legionella massiliensis]|uniref:Hopanoid biosynthesis associated protein HpnK n=1 Tax=Legionella massiliensis TaxID=1034943 RepID=A0A078L0U1_9GAMM|nr:ChbG/HpnK family deacetylase [Legionella massiliensis]CDZ78867.1 hopanoid biosynthesis associated protein HpnK [Legionella massiliensis]CEE14605.1 hypothetical protein BN1094_03182 [Legionella massiliensis]
MIKNIILCADDYGQNEFVCEGILLLAKRKRINAISCLVNTPDWSEACDRLKPVKNSSYLGLHLNLTFGQALSLKWRERYPANFSSLPSLIKQAYLRRLDRDCVEAEICAQIDAFTQAMNAPPDFIDGHQHIHQLPVVREALVSIYKQKNLTAFCRNTSCRWQDFISHPNFPKRQAISLLGGQNFKRLLKRQTILANSSFAGSYNFVKANNYRHYFKRFLKLIHSGGLIMCHPGTTSLDLTDPLQQYRHHEFNYFMSNVFLSDLNDAHCRLVPKVNHDRRIP